MNKKWVMNKIGLLDFWYYDEQEFAFKKGRMLLRGSNGSGKSVTMQSVVPLLLDGNMRPERLDPFGSRDRKMDNYLLEEGDGREERTGYLYLELKREDSETYLTIGIGLRARRGKKLESWYFALHDGRRINKDFFLYKKTDVKITLSKKELEFRLGEGGKLMDTQAEYQEYVNKNIFGFETMDDYKEMIDLLIQLRTPKLSKEFKPSVVNEILSSSLQSLSEEDLRPMSEAIENMDNLKTILDSKIQSKQAADRIYRIYDRYNRYMLFDKARRFYDSKTEHSQLVQYIKDLEEESRQCENRVMELGRVQVEQKAERIALEKEKESLSSSNAAALKRREEELLKRIEELKSSITAKEKQETEKREKWNEIHNHQKRREEDKDTTWQNIEELLEEMSERISDLSFEEHTFMESELKEKPDVSYGFTLHEKQVDEYLVRLEKGIELLQAEKRLRGEYDQKLLVLDNDKKRKDLTEKRLNDYERLLLEVKNEWKEQLYTWNGNNQELSCSDDLLKNISIFIENYNMNADTLWLKNRISDVYFEHKAVLAQIQEGNKGELVKVEKELKEVGQEITDWENKKDPEPEKEEAVYKSRKKLEELGIPFIPFYMAVDFAGVLSEEQCNYLEEALMKMQILDALIIDMEYREQVLALDKGLSDRYIFTDVQKVTENILELLDINNDENDIFFQQRVLSVLSAIGTENGGGSYVHENGYYGSGIITGTITREYKAKYIGVRARRAHRIEMIQALMQRREELEVLKAKLEEQQSVVKKRLDRLSEEVSNLPLDKDARVAARDCENCGQELERISNEIVEKTKEIEKIYEQVKETGRRSAELAAGIYLPNRIEIFLEAKTNMGLYGKNLTRLQLEHGKYLQYIEVIGSLLEQLEDIDADIESILYDAGRYRNNIALDMAELDSVREQLKLTDYDQIKGRLDFCIRRLEELPGLIEEAVRSQQKNSSRILQLEKEREKADQSKDILDKQLIFFEEGLKAEHDLHYVETQEIVENTLELASRILKNHPAAEAEKKIELIERLNQVYHENRGYLMDYSPTMDSLFTEEEIHSFAAEYKRIDIVSKYKGVKIKFLQLRERLAEDIEELNHLLRASDRELFEDILANTVSRKIRGKINNSFMWVENMNKLMNAMNTSSGLKLSLKWKSKTAEQENQLDTRELVELLKKDASILKEEEFERLSTHFRSKVEEARRLSADSRNGISFHSIMKEVLDYRQWFEFQLWSQKTGENKKELTNSVFGTFSGGEKAMAMYVPLFSAVVAKYQGARGDAPRIVSLDEAFAGVDSKNIKDMFRLMVQFEFNFIINSQILWGDCDTVDSLAIYQLYRPENVKYVSVMAYYWNGHMKTLVIDKTLSS